MLQVGEVLPKAHMLEREFQVLKCLQNTNVPTPRVYVYNERFAQILKKVRDFFLVTDRYAYYE